MDNPRESETQTMPTKTTKTTKTHAPYMVRRVRAAVMRECIAAGCKDQRDVTCLAAKAVGGITTMSVAAVKAHITMGHY